MNYPLLILKKGDSNIYAIKKAFGIVSIGGEKFYKNTTIIDSKGNLLRTEKVEIGGRAKLKYCLMYFQKMIELNVTFSDDKRKLKLNELKEILKEKISKNPKKWLSMGTTDEIVNNIESKNNFNDLILMFE